MVAGIREARGQIGVPNKNPNGLGPIDGISLSEKVVGRRLPDGATYSVQLADRLLGARANIGWLDTEKDGYLAVVFSPADQ